MSTPNMALDPAVVATLQKITTATLTTVLLKKGLRNVWIRGTVPIRPGQPRLVGRAFTLRFVPAREDLATLAAEYAAAAADTVPAGLFAPRPSGDERDQARGDEGAAWAREGAPWEAPA